MWFCGRLTNKYRCAENITLKNSTIETRLNDPPEIQFSVNDLYVVPWYLGAKWHWFLGYIKSNGAGENYLVE